MFPTSEGRAILQVKLIVMKFQPTAGRWSWHITVAIRLDIGSRAHRLSAAGGVRLLLPPAIRVGVLAKSGKVSHSDKVENLQQPTGEGGAQLFFYSTTLEICTDAVLALPVNIQKGRSICLPSKVYCECTQV